VRLTDMRAGSIVVDAVVSDLEIDATAYLLLLDTPHLLFHEGVFSWAGRTTTSAVSFTGTVRDMPPPMPPSPPPSPPPPPHQPNYPVFVMAPPSGFQSPLVYICTSVGVVVLLGGVALFALWRWEQLKGLSGPLVLPSEEDDNVWSKLKPTAAASFDPFAVDDLASTPMTTPARKNELVAHTVTDLVLTLENHPPMQPPGRRQSSNRVHAMPIIAED
jgi:hypothetical protein